jgi:septin 2
MRVVHLWYFLSGSIVASMFLFSYSFKQVIKYIDDQFEKYLADESGLNRRHIVDNRVHCCFYFINPSGHGLKPLDVAFMKAVDRKVNIVPVIAKADTMTKQEILKLKLKVNEQYQYGWNLFLILACKQQILEEIKRHQIQIYQLPDCDDDEDGDYKEQCLQLKVGPCRPCLGVFKQYCSPLTESSSVRSSWE